MAFVLKAAVLVLAMSGIAYADEIERDGRPTVGLVLSGGGARGAAHAGVIKVLEEMRVPIDLIVGTSMGAIVGGLYASGLTADELADAIEYADWSDLFLDRPPRRNRSYRRKGDDVGFLVNFDVGVNANGLVFPQGLVQGQKLELALRRLVLPASTVSDFDELPTAFRAVATNIVTGDRVVLGSNDLALAMRASMSAPGVFKPVRIDGQLLVDGGLATNLPIDLIRELGADVLIVVDVGFPLLPEEELDSALTMTSQMLTILINARSREELSLLGTDDILISPELGNLGSEAFERISEALTIGEVAARGLSDQLSQVALSAQDYSEFRLARERRRPGNPTVDQITVDNQSGLSTEVLRARLHDQTGSTLDVELLESDIADIYGLDTFESVNYSITTENNETDLTVQGIRKAWGPNYLRFGINLEDDFSGTSNYNLAARFTSTELNERGGEFRSEVRIGENPGIFAEFFQPLDYASQWFINPSASIERSNSSVFEEGRQIAEFRSEDAEYSLAFGRQFSNWGEARLAIGKTYGDSDIRIGDPRFGSSEIELGTITASVSYDTIDRLSVPRDGTAFTAAWLRSRDNFGSDIEFDIADIFFLKPQSWGKNTLLHWWDIGSVRNGTVDSLNAFTLGGLFSLSGLAPGQINGQHRGIGRLLYYRLLGEPSSTPLSVSIYIGASVEAGNVWNSTNDVSIDNTLTAGSLFVVFDTILGPVYLAYGAAEGGHRSAYLFLGQTF